jgi:hypothetical protein
MSSGVAQREQERRITDLDRQNFDLKMQIFYLNQKLNETQNHATQAATAGSNGKLRSQQSATNGNIAVASVPEPTVSKETYLVACRRMEELERLVVGLKMDRAANSNSESRGSISKDNHTAMVIAENDTFVITKLEKEIDMLKCEHLRDVAMVNECTEKIGEQVTALDEMSRRLAQERGSNIRLQQKISLLVDRVRRSELVLQRHNLSVQDDPITGREILSTYLTTPGTEKPSGNVTAEDNDQLLKWMSPSKTAVRKKAVTHEDFLDFGSRTAWGELHLLRRQVVELQQQLRSERELFKAQEDALKLLQESVTEVGKLEASEVKRLEAELDKCLDSCDKWKKRCKKFEILYAEAAQGKVDGGFAEADGWDEAVDAVAESKSGLRTSAAVVRGGDAKQSQTQMMTTTEHQKVVDMYRYVHWDLIIDNDSNYLQRLCIVQEKLSCSRRWRVF